LKEKMKKIGVRDGKVRKSGKSGRKRKVTHPNTYFGMCPMLLFKLTKTPIIAVAKKGRYK
jgi:hypothetical protein